MIRRWATEEVRVGEAIACHARNYYLLIARYVCTAFPNCIAVHLPHVAHWENMATNNIRNKFYSTALSLCKIIMII